MSKKLKIGIIGMGRMGITHFSIINSHPDIEITSVSDTSKMILNGIAKYLPSVQVFDDFKTQLEKSHPDAVIVCTPPALHFAICRLAHQLGIHIFCEKPFTANPAEANEIAALFANSNLVNHVGYVNRYNDIFKTTRKFLAGNVIGKVIRFRSEMFSGTVIKPENGKGWRASRENGGGVTYEMASHALDLANYMLGAPAKVVGAAINQVFSKTVEDIVSATMLYDGGNVGTVYVNWSDSSYRKPSNKLELIGDKGKILADQYTLRLFLNAANPEFNLSKGWNNIYITDVATPVPFYVRGNEFTRQLYAFVDQILGKEPNPIACTFKEGAETQNVIRAIFEDAANNGKGIK